MAVMPARAWPIHDPPPTAEGVVHQLAARSLFALTAGSHVVVVKKVEERDGLI
jgi:hypothetical protein